MDLRDLSNLYQVKLLEFFASSEGQDEEPIIRNANFLAYFFTELSKRWAERRYHQKRTGQEMTIQEAEEKSLEATSRFFRAQERKRAPAVLAATISDADDLFTFLGQSQPKADDEPEEKKEEKRVEKEEEKEAPELQEEPEKEAPKSDFGGAAAKPHNDGPREYPVISPEEFKRVR